MPEIIVMMGPQGAGKGTQAKTLADRRGLRVVATGDMLREIAQGDTPLGRQVREVQAAGQLVSDDILAEVVRERLCRGDCERGCILDGFPRTLPQARLLERVAQERGSRIVPIEIEVPREMLFRRLTGRRTCSVCGATYHVEFKPPQRPDVCDLDNAPLFVRSDDTEDAIRQRLALYDEKTRPILDYYAESGRLQRVDGTGSPDEVADRIASVVKKGSAAEGEHRLASEETQG